MASGYMLGRQPRKFNAAIPHMSAMMAAQKTPVPLPVTLDYTRGMPVDLGMMLNDKLGDCTCAAFYHARQVWTAHSATMVTEPDSDVKLLYERACGYVDGNPTTDRGANEQDLLTYLNVTGAPIGANGLHTDRILSFVEVDPRHHSDIKRAIYDCGVAYIGFDVPSSIMPDNGPPPSVWDFQPNNSTILGGHAVVLPGYNTVGPIAISWGKRYQMTWPFFDHFVDEAYAITDPAWLNATGKSLMGMSVSDHRAIMAPLHK